MLKSVPYDKKLHLLAGFAVTFAALFMLVPPLALLAAVVAGFGKEGYDMAKNFLASRQGLPEPHSVELDDVAWTVIGGCVGMVLQPLFVQGVGFLVSY